MLNVKLEPLQVTHNHNGFDNCPENWWIKVEITTEAKVAIIYSANPDFENFETERRLELEAHLPSFNSEYPNGIVICQYGASDSEILTFVKDLSKYLDIRIETFQVETYTSDGDFWQIDNVRTFTLEN